MTGYSRIVCYWLSQIIVIMLRQTLLLLLLTYTLAQAPSNLAKEVGALNATLLSKFPNATKESPIIQAALICSLECNWYSIQVNGAGIYNVNPDIATLTIQINANGLTTNDAINALAQRTTSVITTLSSNGLDSSQWKTTYLNIYPNTSYVNGTTVTYGQIAYLDMTITIPLPKTDGSVIARIYDGLAKVPNINIYGLSFDLKNKTSAYIQARALAYKDAVNRANDYTKAAGVTLGAVISVTDTFYYYPYSYNTIGNSSATASSTTVSVGKIIINYNVGVTFAFK